MGKKVTHKDAAHNAGHTLASKESDALAKSVAGSTLAQARHAERVTSERVASEAGKVLRDRKEPPEARSAAGSALAQRETKSDGSAA